MVRLAIISRVSDGLPLSASTDTSKNEEILNEYQKQAKLIIKKMAPNSVNPLPLKASIKSGSYYFHYAIELGVCFMVLCDGSYPKILAFSYLFEIQKEFLDNYTHNEIQSAVRPYPYLTFETNLQKTKKRYLNTRTLRTPHNLGELSIKVQNFKVLDIKSILGAEYKPIEPSNHYHQNSSIYQSQKTQVKDPLIVFASILLGFVSIYRDLFPLLIQDQNEFVMLEEVEHSHTSNFFFVISFFSGVLGFYLFLQAYAFRKRKEWIIYPSIGYGIFSLIFVVISYLSWSKYEQSTVSLPWYLLRISPNLLIILALLHLHYKRRIHQEHGPVHKD